MCRNPRPAPEQYKEQHTDNTGWKVAQPQDSQPRGAWWTLFNDPQLNDLESKLEHSNLSLQAAFARLQQARAQYRIARADLFPSLNSGPSATRERFSANAPRFLPGFPTTYNDFILGADFSYEIDLWGRVRNEVAAAKATQQASAADLAATELSLRAELAEDYFDLRTDDAEVQLLDQTVEDYRKALELTANLFSGGAAALDRRGTGASAAAERAHAGGGHPPAARPGGACHCLAGRREPLRVQPRRQSSTARCRPAAPRSRSAVGAAREAAGRCRGGAPRRLRQRADRPGACRLFSPIHPVGCGWLRERLHGHLDHGPEPLLVRRAPCLMAVVRGRQARRANGSGEGGLRGAGRKLSQYRARRLSGRRRQFSGASPAASGKRNRGRRRDGHGHCAATGPGSLPGGNRHVSRGVRRPRPLRCRPS